MELFGYVFEIGNKLGFYSLFSFIVLIILYLMRPKPLKKIIPSLIFLESSDKKFNLISFFRRFIKDWLLLLQIFIVLFLCIAALDITTTAYIKKINNEVVFVVDASASSQAEYNGKLLFNLYKDTAKKKIGVMNSIVLIKNTPEIVVKQTNPLTTFNTLNSIKPSDSLSNIWDAMMIAGDIANPKANIVVLSDFADSNNRDLSVAKKILEAKGFNVELINPKEREIRNIGVIDYKISGEKITLAIKNYDSEEREIKVMNNGEMIKIPAFSVREVLLNLDKEKSEIEIETKDDFKLDDTLKIILPKESQRSVLFITNKKESYAKAAFESIPSLSFKKAEPPIVTVGDQKIIVLDNVNYDSILPGTIEKIKTQVISGNSLIILAQDKMDLVKLGDLLPIEIIETLNQDVGIINSATTKELKDFNFGLSTRYYKSTLKNTNSIIIAEANDKSNSPIIVLSKYGQGNILFYGIFDEHNQFKLTTQYPLFWINIIGLLIAKEDYTQVNLKVGNIIYGKEIKDPKGNKFNNYLTTEKTGFYRVDDKEIAVNLVNSLESDLNRGNIKKGDAESSDTNQRVKQTLEILPFLILSIILLSFLELYILKKRGDI